MKRLIFLGVACVMLGACGGGGDGSTPATTSTTTTTTTTTPVNVVGAWKGTNSSSVTQLSVITLDLAQTGANVTGSYSTTTGVTGNVTGTVSDATMTMTMVPTMNGCTGSMTGSATVTTPTTGQPTMSYSYSGATSCGGAESGSGNLTKQ